MWQKQRKSCVAPRAPPLSFERNEWTNLHLLSQKTSQAKCFRVHNVGYSTFTDRPFPSGAASAAADSSSILRCIPPPPLELEKSYYPSLSIQMPPRASKMPFWPFFLLPSSFIPLLSAFLLQQPFLPTPTNIGHPSNINLRCLHSQIETGDDDMLKNSRFNQIRPCSPLKISAAPKK